MKLNKWNYEKRDYDEIEAPDLNYSVYEEEMNTIVNCPQCFKEILFGDGYTSKEIHTSNGFGYTVCRECHEKEWERERFWERQR